MKKIAVYIMLIALVLFGCVYVASAIIPAVAAVIELANVYFGVSMTNAVIGSAAVQAIAAAGIYYLTLDRTNGGQKQAEPPFVTIDLSDFQGWAKQKSYDLKAAASALFPPVGSEPYVVGSYQGSLSNNRYGQCQGQGDISCWTVSGGTACSNIGGSWHCASAYHYEEAPYGAYSHRAANTSQEVADSRANDVTSAENKAVSDFFNNDSLTPYQYGNGSTADHLAQDITTSPVAGASSPPAGSTVIPVDGSQAIEGQTPTEVKDKLALGMGGGIVTPTTPGGGQNGNGNGLTPGQVQEAVHQGVNQSMTDQGTGFNAPAVPTDTPTYDTTLTGQPEKKSLTSILDNIILANPVTELWGRSSVSVGGSCSTGTTSVSIAGGASQSWGMNFCQYESMMRMLGNVAFCMASITAVFIVFRG